jgi:hypothetical protein
MKHFPTEVHTAPFASDRCGLRIAVAASVALHVVLLGAIVAWQFGRRSAGEEARDAAAVASAETTADVAAAAHRSRPSPTVTSGQIKATLDEAQQKVAGQSTADQLAELERQAARLEDLASEKSISEIAVEFDEWIPTSERASEPSAAPVAGEFDFDTAQIHDVLRTAADDGQWNYRTVLVDAEGRTFEVEIDRVEGEKTYATFESLKKFPLANQVYRQIAMRLIDKALAERSGSPATSESPSIDGDKPVATDDRDPFDNGDSP